MINVEKLKSHEEWLEKRKKSIGGSDASSILGINHWKSNVKLWLEKKGELETEDISDIPVVQFGIKEEDPIRQLFTLDHINDYTVQYFENNIWTNTEIPFAHASLDGWLVDNETGKMGILEIKTVNIYKNNDQDWQDKIPDYYYTQLLHYMMVTEFDFAILKARIKYDNDYIVTKEYSINRKDVINDINLLKEKEIQFYESLKDEKVPNLILPEI